MISWNSYKLRVIRFLKMIAKTKPGMFLRGLGENLPLVYKFYGHSQATWLRILLKGLSAPYEIVRFFCYKDVPGREGLALVLIAKNEAPYIKEWLDFHIKQGVSHFFIYDNESTDNLHEVLKPYIDSGLVTYSLIKGKRRQNDAYNMAIHDYGRRFKYMGFIDADEFLFVRNSRGVCNLHSYMDEFMKAYPNAGGLGVHWCFFGSNGHKTKPEGGVLENYTRRAKQNLGIHHWVKTICDPMKVWGLGQPHAPTYFKGFFNLDENGEVIIGPVAQTITFEKIRINHYPVKSFEEFQAKRTRGRADILKHWPESYFKSFDRNEVEDTEILSHR